MEQALVFSWWCPHEDKFLGLIIVDAVDKEAGLSKIKQLGIAPSTHYEEMGPLSNDRLRSLSFSIESFKNRLLDELEGETLFKRMDDDISRSR